MGGAGLGGWVGRLDRWAGLVGWVGRLDSGLGWWMNSHDGVVVVLKPWLSSHVPLHTIIFLIRNVHMLLFAYQCQV